MFDAIKKKVGTKPVGAIDDGFGGLGSVAGPPACAPLIYSTGRFCANFFLIASNIPLAPPDLRAHFSTPHLK